MSTLRAVHQLKSVIAEARCNRLTIGVLGGLSLSVADRPLALANRKARALLAYLALEDAPSVSRERLAGLFWSDSGDGHARNSLRQTLMELRNALAMHDCSVLKADRDAISLVRHTVAIDLDTAVDAIAGGLVAEPLLARLAGVDLLLSGYEDLSPIFRDWLAAKRRWAHDRLLRALEDGCGDENRLRLERRRLAEALLRFDPLHEAACRTLMRLAAEDGEIGVSLRAYAALYEALGEELDMEPSAATQALVAEIKQGCLALPRQPAAAPAHPQRPLVRLAQGGAPVVAVLPFHATGEGTMTATVAAEVVEDVVRVLAGLREPIVISCNSTRDFRGVELDLQRVGESLGAHYLVLGSVRIADQRTRISAELIEAASGAMLWSNVYNSVHTNLFETEEHIAAGIANALVPQVNSAELRRSRGHRREDMGGYHLLLHARDLIFRLERVAFEEAGTLLQQAALEDPAFASIHATLADWYSLRVFQGWSSNPDADVAALEAAARRAIRLDPCHARALALLGHNLTLASRRYSDAIGLFDKALLAAPNDAEAWMWSSPTFAYSGESTEAISRAERALSLSPFDPLLFRYEHFLNIAHYAAGNLDEAVHWGQRSMASNPNYTSNLRMTVAAMVGIGRVDDTKPLVRLIMAMDPDFRVAPLITRHAFHGIAQRELYANRLLLAGLPR